MILIHLFVLKWRASWPELYKNADQHVLETDKQEKYENGKSFRGDYNLYLYGLKSKGTLSDDTLDVALLEELRK